MAEKYLYNGVELPALPEYDKEKYPYCTIFTATAMGGGAITEAYFTEIPAILYGDVLQWGDTGGAKFALLAYILGDDGWSEHITNEYSFWSAKPVPLIFTNYDLYSDDGALILPASDPVPVGGEPESVLAWQKHDAYKPNAKWDGNTFYRVMGGKWVKQDAVNPSLIEVEPDVPEPDVPEPDVDPLPPAGTSLEDCTWEQISAISAAGKAEEYFSVGDTKAVYLKGTVGTLELDTTLYVYILGFDHNSEIEGKGITFGTFKTADGKDVALCDSKYDSGPTDGTKYFNINHWSSYNYGGWAASDLRYDILGSTDKAPSGYGAEKTTSVAGYDPSSTCATSPVANTLMAAFPSDLRAVMKPMTKYSNNTAGDMVDTEANVTVTTDYLPLLAEFEVFGARTYASQYEQNKQKQYDYFVAGNSKRKYSHSTGTKAGWWERSAHYNGSALFCYANSNGDASAPSARYSYGIAPIFLV